MELAYTIAYLFIGSSLFGVSSKIINFIYTEALSRKCCRTKKAMRPKK